jgi:hypothetical protein
LPGALRPRVRELALRPDDVVLVLDVGEIRLGTATDVVAKLAAATAVLEQYGGAPFEYIDVRVPANPVAR